jgi:hypothetical protein
MSLRQRVSTNIATNTKPAVAATTVDRSTWASKSSSSGERFPETSRKRIKKSRSTSFYLSSSFLPWISLGLGMFWIMIVYVPKNHHDSARIKALHDKMHFPIHSSPYQAMRGGRKLMQHDQLFNTTHKSLLKLPKIQTSSIQNTKLISPNHLNFLNNSQTVREILIQLEENKTQIDQRLALLKSIRSSQRKHIQPVIPVTNTQRADQVVPSLSSIKKLDKQSKETGEL